MKLLSALLALAAVPSVTSAPPSNGCGPEDLNGVYTYMATTGGNGGKAYTVVVNYDPDAENQDGLFVIFANAMSNGKLIEIVGDDSAFIRFDKTNFLEVDGKCTFGFSDDKELSCPLIGKESSEGGEPLCGFSVTGTKVTDNTWSLDFPPFPTGAPRLMTRN